VRQDGLKYEIKKGDHGMWIPDLQVIEVASQRDVMRVVEEGLYYRAVCVRAQSAPLSLRPKPRPAPARPALQRFVRWTTRWGAQT
jgi:hypothetical protein